MKVKHIPLFLILLTLWGCEKSTPEVKTIEVYGITSKKAVVDWAGVFENEQDLLYQLFLEDTLMTELEHVFFYEIKDLEQKTTYTGKVIATNRDGEELRAEPFSFVTKNNMAPHEFKTEVESIREASVSLYWEVPFDPELDSLTYALVLNGETLADSITETTYSISGLYPLSHYSLVVAADDGHGNQVTSAVAFETTAPGAEIAYVKENFSGVGREYGLFLPSGTGTEKLPLFIHLHGWGGHVWPGMISDHFISLAEDEQFIGLMPQAMADQGGNIAWRDPVDQGFIQQLIDSVTVRHKVDMERIYLTGHSNGAFFTYTLGRVLEYKLAAIGPIAGTLTYPNFNTYSLLKPMPLCHIHGTADSTVQVQGNLTHVSFEKVLEFFIPNNNADPNPTVVELPDIYPYDNSTVTEITYHTQGNSSGDIVYYRINNGNHSIPGITTWSNKDIHAWDVLWAFFKTRKLSDK